MSFSFRQSDDSVETAVRRIAGEQFDKAAQEASNAAIDPKTAIHGVRRRSKKLRGLLRLVGPSFKNSASENAVVREAAAALSANRDADVMIDTIDALAQVDELADAQAQIDAASYGKIREVLLSRRTGGTDTGNDRVLLENFANTMREGLDRSRHWTLKHDGFQAIEDGLVETYRDLRGCMEAALKKPTDEGLHDWRKHVKYHWHHISLLRETAPELLETRRSLSSRVSEMLGDHHNLSVLTALLKTELKAVISPEARKQVVRAARRRQDQLEQDVFVLGRELAAEKPKPLGQRFGQYWSNWA